MKTIKDLNPLQPFIGADLLAAWNTQTDETENIPIENIIGGPGNILNRGADPLGVLDSTTFIEDAATDNAFVYLPPGTYRTTRYIYVNTSTVFIGHGATIQYDSSTVSTDSTATEILYARAGFFVEDADDVQFFGLNFEGDDTETDISVNVGRAIHFRNSKNGRILNCHSKYGGGLFGQDAQTNDRGLRVVASSSYAQRNACYSGPEASIIGNTFEQPTDVGYDRVGSDGSSHGLYFFAGRNNIKVIGNDFKNIRVDGVKCSGTADELRGILISLNNFLDCGRGVGVQSDNAADAQHSAFSVTGNYFEDCGTNRSGWFQDGAISISGIRGIDVSHNNFHYKRHAIFNLAGTHGILVNRFNASQGTPPMENVTITNNHFTADDGLTPSSIITFPLTISGVGQGANIQGSCDVKNIKIFGVGATGITTNKNIGLTIEGCTFSEITTCISLVGDRIPVIRNNTLISTTLGSNNAQLRMNGVSFPIIDGNVAQGATDSVFGEEWTIGVGEGAAAETVIDHPLLGSHGKTVPNSGKQEAVFAYGDGWQDDDTITIDGNTYTYKASPGSDEFNSIASLIALIDGESALEAVDYGDPWSTTTQHIRVRDATANGAAWDITTNTARKTAGVILVNESTVKCTSRGGQATGSMSLIWSPLATFSSTPVLVADNAAAATLLASNSFYTSGRVAKDGGAVTMIEHGTSAGTEQFRWIVK